MTYVSQVFYQIPDQSQTTQRTSYSEASDQGLATHMCGICKDPDLLLKSANLTPQLQGLGEAEARCSETPRAGSRVERLPQTTPPPPRGAALSPLLPDRQHVSQFLPSALKHAESTSFL